MKYDPTEYEMVKSRKKRFYEKYPEGRIIVEIINDNILEYALIKTSLYKDVSDTPFATGYALELRVDKKLISGKGLEYEPVNFASWVENCEESSVGRALDNGGFSGNLKCSRDEMEKAQRNIDAINSEKLIVEMIKKLVEKNGCHENHKNWLSYNNTDKVKMLQFMQKIDAEKDIKK
jgi:hypothetical protein